MTIKRNQKEVRVGIKMAPDVLKAVRIVKREARVNQSDQVDLAMRAYLGKYSAILAEEGIEL